MVKRLVTLSLIPGELKADVWKKTKNKKPTNLVELLLIFPKDREKVCWLREKSFR